MISRPINPMNPFKSLTKLRLLPELLLWPKPPPSPIPIERPPRSRAPRGRLQVIWYGDPTHAFPYEVEEPPPSSDGARPQPWF